MRKLFAERRWVDQSLVTKLEMMEAPYYFSFFQQLWTKTKAQNKFQQF